MAAISADIFEWEFVMFSLKKLLHLNCIISLIWSVSAFTSDGVLEINQACAENTGCFTGDSAGFPVTIQNPGSYRLTGSLLLTDVNVSAIVITSLRVTIDLNRFELRGPVGCGGNGATLVCAPSGSGVGVTGGGGVTILNGSVGGFGAGGIVLNGVSLVREVRLLANNGTGMDIGDQSRAIDSLALRNAGNGIEAGFSSEIKGNTVAHNLANGISTGDQSLIRSNRVWNSGGWGVNVGNGSRVSDNTIGASTLGDLKRANNVTEPLGNSCDGGCSADGRRLFYLTPGEVSGNQALTACATGFHMAALFELLDPSGLRYDTQRGYTTVDSGQGPPTGSSSISFLAPAGWARTGTRVSAATEGPTGRTNCNAWTSGLEIEYGTSVSLWDTWPSDAIPTRNGWPWQMGILNCSAAQVWCIQD